MKYYHATAYSKAKSICHDKEIRTGFEGIVYLADSFDNALKFAYVRIWGEPIILFEIEIPEDEAKLVEETFDHNPDFFQCKSYGYPKNIPISWITDIKQYRESE